MPDGGNLTIRTEVAADGQRAVRAVFEDTGEGMSAEQCQRAFSSLLNSNKPGRLGLGLAIVRRVVEVHRGKLDICSQSGAGSTITITLPVEPRAG
jgi:signal transduction histidine kinase